MRWSQYMPVGLPALLLMFVGLGCGQSGGGGLVPVSGQVTMDNKPLSHATILFISEKHSGTEATPDPYGTTDDEGRFTLKTVIHGKDVVGAAPGKYRVQISRVERTAGPKAKGGNQVPARYNRYSKLEFTVPAEGTQEANFLKLTSK